MTDKQKTYLAETGVGLLIIAYVFFLNRDAGHSLVHVLCDGSFVAGVVLLGSGGLIFCRNKGAFDGISFGMRTAVGLLIPGVYHSMEERNEDYFTYCQRKHKQRKPHHQPLLVGGIYLALATVLMGIYMITG